MNDSILKKFNQNPIAFYPVYSEITGSITAGLMLSQLMCWFSEKDEFYKTNLEIIKETNLTEAEIKTAKRKLKKLNFLEISKKGLPAKTYYKIYWQSHENCINKYFTKTN